MLATHHTSPLGEKAFVLQQLRMHEARCPDHISDAADLFKRSDKVEGKVKQRTADMLMDDLKQIIPYC